MRNDNYTLIVIILRPTISSICFYHQLFYLFYKFIHLFINVDIASTAVDIRIYKIQRENDVNILHFHLHKNV